jgi:hypothetical protein
MDADNRYTAIPLLMKMNRYISIMKKRHSLITSDSSAKAAFGRQSQGLTLVWPNRFTFHV